jgi:hypothetical protein
LHGLGCGMIYHNDLHRHLFRGRNFLLTFSRILISYHPSTVVGIECPIISVITNSLLTLDHSFISHNPVEHIRVLFSHNHIRFYRVLIIRNRHNTHQNIIFTIASFIAGFDFLERL